jgi:hypothetical protein
VTRSGVAFACFCSAGGDRPDLLCWFHQDDGFALGMRLGALALSVLSIGVGVILRLKIVGDVERLKTQGLSTESQLRD